MRLRSGKSGSPEQNPLHVTKMARRMRRRGHAETTAIPQTEDLSGVDFLTSDGTLKIRFSLFPNLCAEPK
jgi:hypothetical protein